MQNSSTAEPTTPTIKLRNLRQLADTGLICHATLIALPSGGFEMEVDTGTRRLKLEMARSKAPRRFASPDGALATLAELRLARVELDLTQYSG